MVCGIRLMDCQTAVGSQIGNSGPAILGNGDHDTLQVEALIQRHQIQSLLRRLLQAVSVIINMTVDGIQILRDKTLQKTSQTVFYLF